MNQPPCHLCELEREVVGLRAEAEATKEQMARDGEARVWLNGGIVNPGSEEKTVITIYGALTDSQREILMSAAKSVDHTMETSIGLD